MKYFLLSLSSFAILVCILLTPAGSLAAEESLDLDQVASPPIQVSGAQGQKFTLMGRVDLSSEFTNPNPSTDPQGEGHNRLTNNHFLVFLKVKASVKTSLMAEIVDRSFFSVDIEASSLAKIQFGKILVPFGDTRRFHHFYGGVQGFQGQGIMFPNIWAEPGVNVNWHAPWGEIDTYIVKSIAASSVTSDPILSGSSGSASTMAEGFRWTFPAGSKVTGILSGYYGEYYYGRNLLIGGADLFTDYGALDLRLFKYTRWSLGLAKANIRNSPSPLGADYDTRGDYLEVATNALPAGEGRLRYGTYIDDTRVETKKNRHSWSLGYSFQADVVRILVEKQWNFEAVEEYNNDLVRVMASLDF